jgi:hypothetical protein
MGLRHRGRVVQPVADEQGHAARFAKTPQCRGLCRRRHRPAEVVYTQSFEDKEGQQYTGQIECVGLGAGTLLRLPAQ